MDNPGDYDTSDQPVFPEINDAPPEATDVPAEVNDIPEAPEISDAPAGKPIEIPQEPGDGYGIDTPPVVPVEDPTVVPSPEDLPDEPTDDTSGDVPSTDQPEDPSHFGGPGGPETLLNPETEPRPEPHFPEAPMYGGGPERGY